MPLKIAARRAEIVKCRFRRDKPQMHQSACRVVNKRQQRALLCAVLKPGVFRSVDLHQLAQAIAAAARLMRGGQTMAAIDPQTRADHPDPQRLAGNRTAVHLCQLLRRQRRTKISVSFANQRQRQITIRLGQTIVARPTAPFRNQAGGAPMLQTGQQPKHLPPLQAEQFAGIRDTQTARPNAQQNFQPIEFLLAHRHHRHRAPPRPLEPRAVSRQLCTGVSSLYCGYKRCVRPIQMSPSLPDRDVTVVRVRRRAGAEPRRSAALARRLMHRPTKPLPLFDRARFSTLGSQASSAKPPGSVISIWQRSDILIGRLHTNGA